MELVYKNGKLSMVYVYKTARRTELVVQGCFMLLSSWLYRLWSSALFRDMGIEIQGHIIYSMRVFFFFFSDYLAQSMSTIRCDVILVGSSWMTTNMHLDNVQICKRDD